MRQAQVLSEKDVKRVLSTISRSAFPQRDRAMFMLSLIGGMRVGEIAALRVADAYEADGIVKSEIRLSSQQTKGSEARTVLLSASMQAELEQYSKRLTRQ